MLSNVGSSYLNLSINQIDRSCIYWSCMLSWYLLYEKLYFCLHYCTASNLSAGLTMSQALRLITVGHWAQNGKISPQHIRGEVSNVLDHATQEELLFKILDTFSFVGNTVINMTGDATNGRNYVCNYVAV